MPHCNRDTHEGSTFTSFLRAKQESKISKELLGPANGKCRGRKKPLRAAWDTWSLGKSVLRLLTPSPEMALTFSCSRLFFLSPLMLPDSSPSHSPPPPPTLLEVQYSQEEMEETGYIPSIVGDKGATSFLASTGQIHKKRWWGQPIHLEKEAETVWTYFKLPHNEGYILNY